MGYLGWGVSYQTALEICRAYKHCGIRLRELGMELEAGRMFTEEKRWRREYIKLAGEQQADDSIWEQISPREQAQLDELSEEPIAYRCPL